MIRSRAAVAWAPGQPLDITEIEVAPPKDGEVLLQIVARGFVTQMPTPCPVRIRKDYFQPCLAMRVAQWLWRSGRT